MFFKKIKNMIFPKKTNFNQTRETIYCFKVHVCIQLYKKNKNLCIFVLFLLIVQLLILTVFHSTFAVTYLDTMSPPTMAIR